jgi:hypothetical protein
MEAKPENTRVGLPVLPEARRSRDSSKGSEKSRLQKKKAGRACLSFKTT